MMSVGIAIVLMVAATMAVHMGLPQEVAKVITKICGCHKCLSFWLVLVVTAMEEPLWLALLFSLLAAYLSGWFAVVLVILNKIYEKLWERLNK
jgi:hypothetical protein